MREPVSIKVNSNKLITSEWFKDVLGCFLLLAAVAIVFYPMTLCGRVLYWGDIALYFHPLSQIIAEQLKNGQVPLWNPYFACGQPLLGNPQAWVFYPTVSFLKCVSPEQYITGTFLFHTVLAGIGMYLYLRKIALSRLAGWFGACAFMLCGSMVSRGQFPPILQAAAYWSWLVWAVERTMEKPSFGRATTFGFITALVLLAAHPQTAHMMALVCAGYLLWRFFHLQKQDALRFRKALWLMLVVAITAVAGAMAYLLPTVQHVLQSNREILTYSGANRFLLFPEQAGNMILPTLFGSPATGDYVGRGNYWESCCYIGILPIILAFFAIFRVKPSENIYGWNRFWGYTALISFWLALGRYGGLYLLFFKFVPGVKSFHDPGRWLMLTNFAVAILAAIGLEQWMTIRLTRPYAVAKTIRWSWAFMFVVSIVVAIWLLICEFSQDTAQAVTKAMLRTWNMSAYPFIDNLTRAEWLRNSSMRSLASALFLMGVATAWMLMTQKKQSFSVFWLKAIACSFLLMDLGMFSSSLLPTVSVSEWKKALNKVAQHKSGNGRIINAEPSLGWMRNVSYIDYDSDKEHIHRLIASLTPNISVSAGYKQADAYEPVALERSAEAIALTVNQMAYSSKPSLRMLNMMDVGSIVKYNLSWEGQQVSFNKPIKRAFVPRFAIPVFNKNHAIFMTQCGWSDDPSWVSFIEEADEPAVTYGTCRIISEKPGKIVLQADAASESWVVLSEAGSVGWKVKVNNQPADWKYSNIMFMAAPIPVGQSEIVFEYAPDVYIVGLFFMLTAYGILGAAIGYKTIKILRRL